MKQGINFKLPIQIGLNLNEVEAIEFLFKQGETVKEFLYPSDKATRRSNLNIVDLHWTKEETYLFKPSNLELDTRIKLIGTDDQPETPIIILKFNPTLFEKEHEHD